MDAQQAAEGVGDAPKLHAGQPLHPQEGEERQAAEMLVFHFSTITPVNASKAVGLHLWPLRLQRSLLLQRWRVFFPPSEKKCKVSVEGAVPPAKRRSYTIQDHNPLCYFF